LIDYPEIILAVVFWALILPYVNWKTYFSLTLGEN